MKSLVTFPRRLSLGENVDMDWKEIRKFIEESGGRVLIVIDGQPSLVVSSYQNESNSDCLNYSFENSDEDDKEIKRQSLMIDDLPL